MNGQLRTKPFTRFGLDLILILICLSLFALAGNGCRMENMSQPAESLDDDELAALRLSAAQGGNLHYENLVLVMQDQIIFNSSDGKVILADADGGSQKVLASQPGSYWASNGESLFYTLGTPSGKLAKVGLDGSNQVRIGQVVLKYLLYHDNLLYAIEADDGQVISIQTDGNGREVLADFQAAALTLSENRLFITGVAEPDGLAMINFADGKTEILLNQKISSLNISGDWLYFADPANNYYLNAWSIKEKTGSVISSFSVNSPFVISGGFVYYIEDAGQQRRLFRLPVDGRSRLEEQAAQLVVDDAVGSFSICGDLVYYQRPESSRIYRVPATGGQVVRIT